MLGSKLPVPMAFFAVNNNHVLIKHAWRKEKFVSHYEAVNCVTAGADEVAPVDRLKPTQELYIQQIDKGVILFLKGLVVFVL